MNQRVCAVIVAAWKAERWIEECVDSINKQRSTLAWRYELRLGVDGCEATREVVRSMGCPFYWSPTNVGPYIIRNSLMTLAPADTYAVFDADDKMMDTYLQTLLKETKNGIAGTGRITINEKGSRIQARTTFRQGVCIISAQALQKLGGYRPDRCASDADLIIRAKLLGIPVTKAAACLYYRRQVSTSLTQSPETGMKSPYRKSVVRAHAALREKGELFVKPQTTPLIFSRGFKK